MQDDQREVSRCRGGADLETTRSPVHEEVLIACCPGRWLYSIYRMAAYSLLSHYPHKLLHHSLGTRKKYRYL